MVKAFYILLCKCLCLQKLCFHGYAAGHTLDWTCYHGPPFCPIFIQFIIYSVYYYFSDIIMNMMASQINSNSIVCSTVCSGTDEWIYQSSVSLAFVRWIHCWPVDFPHKVPVTWKMLPSDDIIIWISYRGVSVFATDCPVVFGAMGSAFASFIVDNDFCAFAFFIYIYIYKHMYFNNISWYKSSFFSCLPYCHNNNSILVLPSTLVVTFPWI